MQRLPISVAVEGPTDTPVARRILSECGFDIGPVHETRGKAKLDRSLRGFNAAAGFKPWFVVRDLDHDAPCAPALLASLLPEPAARMCFRIAVRQTEAWLLADRERMARFLGVDPSIVPADPDALPNPKLALIDLARRSRLRPVREDVLPLPGTTAKVGPGYLARVTEFAARHWRPRVAARSSDSLRRCLRALRRGPLA